MKLRTILASAALLLFSAVAFAQNTEDTKTEVKDIKAEVEDIRTNDWFFGVGGGLNIGFDGQKYAGRKNSHRGSGAAVTAYFGKYFTKVSGFRVGYTGIATSNQYKKFGKDEFHYAHADFLVRAGNVLVPYAHAGFVSLANKSAAGFGLGLMAPIRLSRVFSVVPDLRATAIPNAKFSGEKKRMGFNLTGTLGLRISFPGGARKQPPVVVEPEPIPVKDTVVIIQVQKDTVVTVQKDTAVIVHKDTTVIEKPELPVPKTSLVYFKVGKFVLDENSREILDKYAEYLLQATDINILIEGHASSEGSLTLNKNLAIRRANVVREYLTRKGVKASRITVEGKGIDFPVADNATEAGRRLNRRAVVIVQD